jgi:hypothetical protein
MSDAPSRATWGRIGGLTAWARNDPETMVGPAHAGFRRRFERLVDPEGILEPRERAVRADRARRAYMLSLAAKSAQARRARATKAAAVIQIPATADVHDEPPSST